MTKSRSRGPDLAARIYDSLAAAPRETRGRLPLGNRRDPLDELLFILLTTMTQYGAEAAFRALKAEFSPWGELLRVGGEERLRACIAPLGLVDQKAPRVLEVARRLRGDFGDVTLDPLKQMGDAEAEQYLTSLPGVGLKDARCVLMYSLGRAACPVDTHVYRVARRTGLVPEGTSYAQAHEAVHRAVPPELRYGLHVGFVRLGRTTCVARRPHCTSCPLSTARICLYAAAQTP